jgi:hypothetical protein
MVYGVYTMKRKQIYIAKDQEYGLKKLAERRGVSESLLIREAVAQYLVEHETPELRSMEDHPLWGIVGICDDPDAPTDGSINHDFYLYGAPKVEE